MNLKDNYFNWLIRKVGADGAYDYNFLWNLHLKKYSYVLPMDANRYEDGINLRYRFAAEEGYDERVVSVELDNMPCTILEMMVALSLRIEETIMFEDKSNQKGKWFWDMIRSLGINGSLDSYEIDEILDKFCKNDYEETGRGGLFYIPETMKNLRNQEIWYQAMLYLRQFI